MREVLDDLVGCLEPKRLTVVSRWNIRGGIETTVTATYPNCQLTAAPK